MANVSTIGIDLAKNVFQFHGVDNNGKVVFQRKLTRKKVILFLSNLPPCLIGLEACAGANHWAREIQKLGHDVKLISPQFVKPYVKNDKSDANDAAGICEAVTRPHMRFVPIKKVEQQDIQNIHRIRERLVKTRTALINEIRSLLHEYGIIMPQGVKAFKVGFPLIIADAENELTSLTRELMTTLFGEFNSLEEQIGYYEKKLNIVYKSSPDAQRLATIPGVGKLTATAIIASVSDARLFKNGREFSAWLGLVPRQNSSGGKQKLLGITKRGDCYIRKLLIHGARASMRWIGEGQCSSRSAWALKLKERRGFNIATVALANKNARVVWSLLVKEENYKHIAA